MLFPEIRSRLRKFLPDSGEPISLGLQTKGTGFETGADWYARNGYPGIYALLAGGSPSWAGESVDVRSALGHSVVWACNRIISESIGYIPAMMKQQKGSSTRDAEEHPMYSAMLNAPNEEITAQAFSESLTSHCLLAGGGFARINRRSGTGTAIQLDPLLPERTRPDREKTGQKRLVYVVSEPGSPDKTYTVERGKPHDILHLRGLGWDGIKGYNVVDYAKQSIGTANAQERNVGAFWKKGGRLPYVLEMERKFATDQDFQKFRADWEETYKDPHKAFVLENGIKHKQTGLSMRDSQTVESRMYTIPEICRWFSISPHLVGDLSRATFSNIEELGLLFVKMTLSTWISRWEQEFWRCVLTPEEKAAGYFLRHNIRELLRGDFKTRMEGYASALQNGHMSIDEVRYDNDYDVLPNGAGSHYHVQLNMGTLMKDGQVQQPEKLMRIDDTVSA